MKTIYYAHASQPDLYYKDFMTFQAPDSLYKDLLTDKDEKNNWNNFMDCPAFLKSIHNTFIIRLPWTTERIIDFNSGKFLNSKNEPDAISEYFLPKDSSRNNKLMMNVYHHMLYFCEDSIEVTAMPAYLHSTDLQTKCIYIPGTFDISNWLRPVDGAMELRQGVNSLKINTNDPIYYIKFNTTEPIKFVRFNVTAELWGLVNGCVQHKFHQPRKGLAYLYKIFQHTGMKSLVLKHIKANIIK
jgi:hypothetical protein